MPHYFLDTSALAKHYHPEVGSGVIHALFNDPTSSFTISRLTLTEIASLVAKKMRTGIIGQAEFADLRLRFIADVNKRLVRPARVLNGHFDMAAALIEKHGRLRHLYTLDALQLAVALSIRQPSPLDVFVCSDQRLIAVAQLEGLNVLDPEQP